MHNPALRVRKLSRSAKRDAWHRRNKSRSIRTGRKGQEEMILEELQELVNEITQSLVGRNLDTKLEAWLNAALPPE